MSGVGSFSKPCRTLYVAGLMKSKVFKKRKKEREFHMFKPIIYFIHPTFHLFIFFLDQYDGKELEDALWKHFGEWGEIESVNVVLRLSIAFIRLLFVVV